jgi:DNA polymerase I-like protein with 3'-5' exonuclease and polymerase domains
MRKDPIAYIDWEQQEPGIASALSGDAAMQAAYQTGNIYLGFVKQIGAVPEDATKKTHPAHHELFKQTCLGINYGMGVETLARRINRPTIVARGLIRAHHERYRIFWRWSDAALDTASLTGSLHTVFGWQVHLGESQPTNYGLHGQRSPTLWNKHFAH